VLALILALIVSGYDLDWTGFGEREVLENTEPKKLFWDWMELQLVPVTLAIVAAVFTLVTNRREREAEESRAREQRETEDRRAKEERAMETDRAREAALQAYLDRIGELLLLKPGLRESKMGDSVRDIARADAHGAPAIGW
jgi:hypothetical protein